jgi:hypothetical protein
MRSDAVRAVVVVILALSAGGALLGGCQRPCETSDNCKRTCECVDGQTSVRSNCTMAFRCEGETQVCEADYDGLSCDDMCAQYAARAECGFERCEADAECTKQLTCPILDAQGNPTSLAHDCTLTFICDQNQKLCEAASTQSDAQLCADPRCTGG